ncbi:hypothetical protein [Marinilabilia salmonicolor]|nr:hypothetical protein [Marinilabilia salmonicolor]
MEFNNLNWHDSIIKRLIVDRENPGREDVISIEIVWPDGKKNVLSFIDVYWAQLNLNFGIICEESIYDAHCERRENEIVKEVYSKWGGMINDIELNYYEIETNSTSSKIMIISQGFKLQ